MLQIRITEGNGSNPVILEGAANRQHFKSLNSSDEGISFELAKVDPKSSSIDPYSIASFTRLVEVWETTTNKRLNYGPITSIDDQGSTYKVQAAGRSALLNDHFQSLKTFYARIDSVIDEIRYENVAVAPSSSTMVARLTTTSGSEDNGSFIYFLAEDKYHSLSKKSKDFAIDDQTNYIPIGKIEPPRTFTTTSEYWTGMSMDDTLMVDFGDIYKISKLRLMFPWWGGPQRANNRSYDFEIRYASEGSMDMQGRPVGSNTKLWDSSPSLYADYLINGTFQRDILRPAQVTEGNKIVTTPGNPIELFIGTTASGSGTNTNTFYTGLSQPGGIDMRYLGVHIYNVNALYGNTLDALPANNFYPYQCNEGYQPGDVAGVGASRKGLMAGKEIPDTAIKPANDCNASIIEIGAYQEIIEKKSVKPLAIQRVDNNSRQITYYRVPDPSELTSYTVDGLSYRRFEPGTFFRTFEIDWSNAASTYNKFYKKDCSNCYPDGFNFGVMDDDNTLILASDEEFGPVSVTGRQYTKHILTKGTADVEILSVDAWKGKTDPLSWGGSYSYTEKSGDYFIVDFNGESFKWYATIPDGKTGARVQIDYRKKAPITRRGPSKSLDNIWRPPMGLPINPSDDGWRVLESDLKLPEGVSNEVVYEIPYGSGLLDPETPYQLRITLLDNNYCSVDSIEGYWYASFTEYNEDSNRIISSSPDAMKQIYDKRFTGGSMYKWNKSGAGVTFNFEGDKLIIQSAKGRNHGKLKLQLLEYVDSVIDYDDPDNIVWIPTSYGGSATDGSLTINLNTGKRGQEIPNAIVFDSNDAFGDLGLPWRRYTVRLILSPAETYTTTKYETGSDSFQYRCRDCNPKTSKQVTINKYVYLDAIGVHERVGLSVNFDQQPHLEILKSVAEAIQVEWDASVDGLLFEPRLGTDTDIALREGENTVVNISITNDVSKVATRLLSYGTSIDGLDMFSITEDKKSRKLFGRTITRQNDFRDIGAYTQLIGLSRMELKRRNRPEKRISIQHTAASLNLVRGDSFILWTKKAGAMRLRIQRIQTSESSGGRAYDLECIEWPQIV